MPAPFRALDPSHLVVLALTFAVPLALAAMTRCDVRAGIAARIFFVALLGSAEAFWLWLVFDRDSQSAQTLLPMQLCDWAMVAVGVTLVRPNRLGYELAYFWAMCGSLQALFTPDLAVDFPDPRFVVFFLQHGGVIASVIYLTLGMRLRPVVGSIPRVIAGTLVYLIAAGTTDTLLGTNFGFLAAKPTQDSLLSLLAPWPFYILELVPIGLLLIAIFYAPFFVLDRIKAAPRA